MQALVVYPRKVRVPMAAVIAIYARENGAGRCLSQEPAYEEGYTPSLVDDEQHGSSKASATEGLSF